MGLGASWAEDWDAERDIDPPEYIRRWPATDQDWWSIDSDGVNVPGDSNRDVTDIEEEERFQLVLDPLSM